MAVARDTHALYPQTEIVMDFLMLDKNENQYGPAPVCFDAVRTADLADLSLYSRSYLTGTKSDLSARLADLLGIPEERVLLSYGSEDMLKQAVHCYLRPGGTLLLPEHSWWYYGSLAGEVYARQVRYPLRDGGTEFRYDAETINRLYDIHRPQVILIASPNNPTGNSIAAVDLHSVLSHCSSSVIVLDQAYHGFSGDDAPLRDILASHGRIAVLRTFSKYYALAGLRIGYACVSSDLRHLGLYSARYLGFNRLSEKIALAALSDPLYYRHIAGQMHRDKTLYYELFATMNGFTPYRSDANFLLLRYPADLRNRLEQSLLGRGIGIKFLNDQGLEDCFRITIGTMEQNARVIAAFRELVDLIPAPAKPLPLPNT